jgi:hypothetical protein
MSLEHVALTIQYKYKDFVVEGSITYSWPGYDITTRISKQGLNSSDVKSF